MRSFNTDYLQIIPLLALTAYFFYLTYYYAAPMFWLKVLLFWSHIRYRGAEIRFSDGKITIKLENDGKERVLERTLDADPTSRFFAMEVCREYREMIRETRHRLNAAEEDADGLSAGKRTRRAGRQRTEENCD